MTTSATLAPKKAKKVLVETAANAEPAKKKKTITAGHKDFERLTAKAEAKTGTGKIEEKTSTVKAGKKAKAQTIATTAKKVIESESEGRELKYVYPADCKTKSQKKEFRRKARATLKSFEKQISKFEKSTDKKAKADLRESRAAFAEWQSETYGKALPKATVPEDNDDDDTPAPTKKKKKAKGTTAKVKSHPSNVWQDPDMDNDDEE